jgi:hypothetical protein
MKKIKIFLASSEELADERKEFALAISSQNKLWFDEGIFLHLDIWEDSSARMSPTRSQDDYNDMIRQADLFVLLGWRKIGPWTHEEFIAARGHFLDTQKPFIYIYFKDLGQEQAEASLREFQQKLRELEHFPAHYTHFHHLWTQFSNELERLRGEGFMRHPGQASTAASQGGNRTITQGEKSTYIEQVNGDVHINNH